MQPNNLLIKVLHIISDAILSNLFTVTVIIGRYKTAYPF